MKNKTVRLLLFTALAAVVAVALVPLAGCGSGGGSTVSPTPVPTATPTPTPTPNPTQNAPRALFGQWRLVSTSGGITGNGYAFTPGTESVTFNEDGNFSRVSNAQATQGTYRVFVAPFNTAELNTDNPPIITYSTTTQTEAITEVTSTRLVLSERAADGYVREYERDTKFGG